MIFPFFKVSLKQPNLNIDILYTSDREGMHILFINE